MDLKKTLVVNCDVCDTRKVNEESLSMYENIILNADMILVNERSKAVLNRLPLVCNMDDTIEAEGDMEVVVQNGNYRISGSAVPEGNIILCVNGSLEIAPDAADALRHYNRITVNGKLKCPEGLSGCLDKVTVNGSREIYPDDCIMLDDKFYVDRYFSLRAKDNARYYAEKRVILTDSEADAADLAAKGVKFFTKKLIVYEERLKSALELVDETVALEVIPDGCAYVGEDAELSKILLAKYGSRLYIDGDLTLTRESTPFLAQLSYLKVCGQVSLLAEQEEAFHKLNPEYGSLEIVKGRKVKNKVRLRLDSALLDASPDGISIKNCGSIELDEALAPQRIFDEVKIANCGKIICTDAQRGAVELVSSNAGFIGTAEEAEKNGFGDMLKQMIGTRVINADWYHL